MWGVHTDTSVVEITVPRPRHPRLDNVIVHRSTDLTPSHVTRRARIPVTNPIRTVIDLGSVLRAGPTEDALERGLISRLYSVAAIERHLADVARRGRSGAGVISKILDERALGKDRPDGLLEARMARLLVTHGLPGPVFQHWIKLPRHRPMCVDFCYVDVRLVIEVLGFDPHSTRERMLVDIERRNVLTLNGYDVLEFMWEHVVRRPRFVASTIEAKLAVLGPVSAR